MNKKFITALLAYFGAKQNKLEGMVKENSLTAEELEAAKAELESIKELLEGIDPESYEGDAETLKKEIIEKLSETKESIANECKDYVENAVRLMAIANEPNPTPKKVKKFAKLYENQIKLLQTQLGVQTFENAITITPSGSLPIPSGVSMAEPAVILPKIFEFAAEEPSANLVGNGRGAKLRVIKMTNSGNLEQAIAEGVAKPITELTASATDVTPLKVAVVIENVTLEQIEFNDWLESVLKIYCTKLLKNNLEVASVDVLDNNSTAYDGTSAAHTVTEPFLENVAVAGASQLAAANYFGQKVALVNEADWVNNLNAQTTTAYPVENRKIAEHIIFVPSGGVPSGTMYVADADYLRKRMFKDVFVERAIAHTHDAYGNREYNNATDYIFDLLAFFYVTDAGAVIKLDIANTEGIIKKP